MYNIAFHENKQMSGLDAKRVKTPYLTFPTFLAIPII